MRTILLIAGLVLVTGSIASAADVYIVAGQSNGWRMSSLRAGDSKLPNGRKVYYYGMKCVSEPDRSTFQVLASLDEKAMGTQLAKSLLDHSDGDIIFIQYCRCGAGVWNNSEKGWYPGDNPMQGAVFDDGLYGKLTAYLKHARKSANEDYGLEWNVKGLFWHQGESDSNGDHFKSYHRNLTNLIWRFRHDLADDLPIVVGEIRELTEHDNRINKILKQIANNDEHTAIAKATDLKFRPDRDGVPDVHFDLEGCRELGKRMVAELTRLTSPRS